MKQVRPTNMLFDAPACVERIGQEIIPIRLLWIVKRVMVESRRNEIIAAFFLNFDALLYNVDGKNDPQEKLILTFL